MPELKATARNLGVLAIVPFWSNSDNLNTDSNYAFLRIVLPEMARLAPKNLYAMFFPDPKYGKDKWTYTPDGLQSERIKFVPWPYDTAMQSSVLGYDPVRHSIVEQSLAPTIYWLQQVELGAALKGGYRPSYNNRAQPTLIAQHHYIIHKSLPYPIDTLFARRWYQTAGSVACDRVIYNSEYARQMARESFGEILRDEQLAALEQKSSTLLFGLVQGDEPIAPVATTQPPVILYNHRFEAYKQYDATFDVIAALRERFKFEVWTTQRGQPKVATVDRVVFEPYRANYLARCAVPAINTTNSIHETFCISILDSMMLGHIVVLPRRLTFPELVPQGYPFLFDSVSEQTNMLAHILATWPLEYNKWREQLSAHARARFNLTRYAINYLNMIADAEQEHRIGESKQSTVKKLDQLWERMIPDRAYSVLELKREMQRSYQLADQAMPARRVLREAICSDRVAITWDNGVVKLRRTR